VSFRWGPNSISPTTDNCSIPASLEYHSCVMITPIQAAVLAGRLRAARVRRLWTQQQLAEASGVSRATIARIESNRLIPQMRSVASIAQALKVDPHELLGDTLPA
jgi:DNA-binding XRE family transcriptional regulator